jgi:hypothetical protein
MQISDKKSFIGQTPGGCTVQNYRFVMYGFYNKQVCLTKPVKVTDNNKEKLVRI